MKILIVDDNSNNRMLLGLLLADYSDENKMAACDIEECSNGLEALKKIKESKFDLIFMDIMMPEMDGIEATRKIRAYDKDVMIIAVSASEDEMKQKEILRCGAEDYISKPLDAEQLFSRLGNYFSLLSLRSHETQSTNSKSVNLYTKKIFHRQIIFYVESEEALSEFWEYYLLDNDPLKVDNLSDVVRTMFSLGELIVQADEKPWIIVEADKDALYFTLNKIECLGGEMLQSILRKNKEIEIYKYTNEKISFKLEKKITLLESEVFETQSKPTAKKAASPVPEPIVQDIAIKKSDVAAYRIYHYMDPEDLAETEELLGDLHSFVLMMGTSNMEASEVNEISILIDSLGRHLSVYTESYTIGRGLTLLSRDIASNVAHFQEIAKELSALSSAFVADLHRWLKMTFYEGAPSLDFMDDTIIANAQMISAMLNEEEPSSGTEDLDDIFDF